MQNNFLPHVAPESQRSSTYAQMSDFTLSTHAPTPPPVEVLKHLSHEISGMFVINLVLF